MDDNRSEKLIESPLAAAKDRFQASAREFIRNIENVMNGTTGNNSSKNSVVVNPDSTTTENNNNNNNEGSLEQAFRLIFSSCTTGAAAMAAKDDNDLKVYSNPLSSKLSQETSSLSSSNRSRSRSMPASASRRSSSIVSATPGSLLLQRQNNNGTRSNRSSSRKSPSPSRVQTKVVSTVANPTTVGEHIYEQLFFDDKHDNRSQTIDMIPLNRRQRTQSSGASPNNNMQQQKKRYLTKPFPVSSPPRELIRAKSCPSEGISIPNNDTFDDGISAISAHTLEAMAIDQPSRSRSIDSYSNNTNKQRNKVTPQIPRTPSGQRNRLTRDLAPLNISVNSSLSTNRSLTPNRSSTPQSRHSRATQSSSKSFERWQNTEQEFWEAEVKDDQKKQNKRNNSKRITRHRTKTSNHYYNAQDSTTLSTASSTAHNSWAFHDTNNKHPHDTICLQFQPNNIAVFDEQQGVTELVLPTNTETGEI